MWGWSQLHGLLPSTTIPSAARFCVAGPTAEDHFRPLWGAPHPATVSGVSICSSFAETQEDLVAPLAAGLETHLTYLCRPWQFFIDTPRAAYVALLCAPMDAVSVTCWKMQATLLLSYHCWSHSSTPQNASHAGNNPTSCGTARAPLCTVGRMPIKRMLCVPKHVPHVRKPRV